MEKHWYYIQADNSQAGPFSFNEMQELAKNYAILSTSHVWNAQLNAWKLASDIEHLLPKTTKASTLDRVHSNEAPIRLARATKVLVEEQVDAPKQKNEMAQANQAFTKKSNVISQTPVTPIVMEDESTVQRQGAFNTTPLNPHTMRQGLKPRREHYNGAISKPKKIKKGIPAKISLSASSSTQDGQNFQQLAASKRQKSAPPSSATQDIKPSESPATQAKMARPMLPPENVQPLSKVLNETTYSTALQELNNDDSLNSESNTVSALLGEPSISAAPPLTENQDKQLTQSQKTATPKSKFNLPDVEASKPKQLNLPKVANAKKPQFNFSFS